jgi:ABC-type tungstate transport system permease subunit
MTLTDFILALAALILSIAALTIAVRSSLKISQTTSVEDKKK